jgi:outer membrane biosynthesis protein TonB
MKSPAGRARPVAKKKKQVRLDLRRAAPPPDPDDEISHRQRSNFWKWFALVALFHLLLLTVVLFFYHSNATPPPPTQFISLVPEGETVKGTPGMQSAPKVGASTPAPAHHHHHTLPKPPAPPQPVTPPPPEPAAVTPPETAQPKPIVHEENAPAIAETKPKPPKPKIKVDLHLADGPMPAPEKKPIKPKHPKKKPALVAEDQEPDRDAASAENMGLSKEQIAQRLGQKLEAAGVTHADKSGTSGAADGHNNPFSDFYASIHDQVMNKWQEPNQDDLQAVDPIVQIHVEADGRVPPEQVTLLRGSGNPAIDDSALGAARSLGYTLQPLPDGCPPDISITFKLTH